MSGLTMASALIGLLSAALWFWSALVKIEQGTWWNGPPPHVVKKINRQKMLNATAAATTGLSVLLQAVSVLISN